MHYREFSLAFTSGTPLKRALNTVKRSAIVRSICFCGRCDEVYECTNYENLHLTSYLTRYTFCGTTYGARYFRVSIALASASPANRPLLSMRSARPHR